MLDKIKNHLRELWLDRGIITFVLSPFLFLALCHYFQIITKENYIEHITVLFAALFIIIAVFHERQMEEKRKEEKKNAILDSIVTEFCVLINAHNSIEGDLLKTPPLPEPVQTYIGSDLFLTIKNGLNEIGSDVNSELIYKIFKVYTLMQQLIASFDSRNKQIDKLESLLKEKNSMQKLNDMDKTFYQQYNSSISYINTVIKEDYIEIIQLLELIIKEVSDITNTPHELTSQLTKKAP